MKKIFFLIVLGSVLLACKNDDDKEVSLRTVFTFKLGNYKLKNEVWIVLRDDNTGDLIDSRMINPNTTEVFESTKPIKGNMAVSLFEGSLTSDAATVSVHSGIKVGSSWEYAGPRSPTISSPSGSVVSLPFKITNVPLFTFGITSDSYVDVPFSLDDYNSGDKVIHSSAIFFPPYLYIVIDAGGIPKYLRLQSNISSSQEISIPFSAFKDFDKVINFNAPSGVGIFARVFGYDAPPYNYRSYIINPTSEQIVYNVAPLTFINSFTAYSVEIFASKDGISEFEYRSVGPIPTSIEYIDPNLYQVSGSTIDNVTVTSTNSFVFKDVYFRDAAGVRNITIDHYSTTPNQKIFDPFSPEISNKFNVEKSMFKYFSTTFHIDGRSYSDFLRSLYDLSYDINSATYYYSAVTIH